MSSEEYKSAYRGKVFNEYDDDDEEIPDILDTDNIVGGKSYKCINKSMVMQANMKISDGNVVTSNITLFIREIKTEGKNKYIIECIPYESLVEYLDKLDSCMFVWNPKVDDKINHPIIKLPSTGIWIEAPYQMLTRYSAFYIYEYNETSVGSLYEHFSSRVSYTTEHVGRIRPISKIDFINNGIVRGEIAMLKDPLDFAPNHYPRYSVTVERFDDDFVETPIGVEQFTGISYDFNMNGEMEMFVHDISVYIIQIKYKFLYTGFIKYINVSELKKITTPDGYVIDYKLKENEEDKNTLEIECKYNNKLMFKQIIENIYTTDGWNERQPSYREFLQLGIPETELIGFDRDGDDENAYILTDEDEEDEDQSQRNVDSDADTDELPENEDTEYDNEEKKTVWFDRRGKIHREGDLPAIIWDDGTQEWYRHGDLHRENDKPAIVESNGTKMWYIFGKKNRHNDKPSVEWSNGDKEWYYEDLLDREEDLPAIVRANGTREWWRNGKRHREDDLPAIIDEYGGKMWYQYDKLHRDGDLPAIVYEDGSKEWYKNGIRHRDGDRPAVDYIGGLKEWWVNGTLVRSI
jgi:hypothetical protein